LGGRKPLKKRKEKKRATISSENHPSE